MQKTQYARDSYELMLNPPKDQLSFEIDNSLVSEFEDIFKKLKGEPKSIRSNKGEIHLPYIIDFKSNQKNLKVFKRKINQNSGNIILLIDGSGTMRFDKRIDTVRSLVANLYKAISEIGRINLKAYIYGGSFEDPNVLCITPIEDLNDCKKITYDASYYGSTPTHYAVDYVTKENKDLKGKKLIITITDGQPEIWKNHRQVNNQSFLKEETKRAFIEAENNDFNIFGVGIGLYDKESFMTMFRDEYVDVMSADDIKKYMIDKMQEFVRGIR